MMYLITYSYRNAKNVTLFHTSVTSLRPVKFLEQKWKDQCVLESNHALISWLEISNKEAEALRKVK